MQTTDRTIKSTAVVGLSLVLLVAVACDPGVTVRQSRSNVGTPLTDAVELDVKTSRHLIGESWYAPKVEIGNHSYSPIYVTNVELIAQGRTLQNAPRRVGTYPAEIAAGKSDVLDIWFNLADSVRNTFREPAILRVHYLNKSSEQTVSVQLIGGGLGPDSR
jgi:hypothetical protein